jgi:hypothetical protein
MRTATSIPRIYADERGFFFCHPERSEGPMHLVCGETLRTSYTGPSRKERAQDDNYDLAEMVE